MELFNCPLFWGMVWAVFLLIIYFVLPPTWAKYGLSLTRSHMSILVVAIAIAVRLIPNLLLPMGAGYDIESYQIVGNLVLQKIDVYTSQGAINRHPYLPLQMYWMAFCVWLTQLTALPFLKIIRLAPIFADAGIAFVITSHLYPHSKELAFQNGLLYALNPISIFVSAYHGQFDAIPILFIMLSVCSIEQSLPQAGLWLGFGILSKSWPVLALPTLATKARSWYQRIEFLVATALVPLAGIGLYALIFKTPAWTIIKRAASYNWGVGVWGYTYFFHLASVLYPAFGAPFMWLVQNGRYLTLAALGLTWILKARKETPVASILTVLIAFFAFTHAFSIQYLIWLVPFALLTGEKQDSQWLARYTLGAFSYMFLTYSTLILNTSILNLMPWNPANTFLIRPSALPAWIVTFAWLISRFRVNYAARQNEKYY